MATPFLITGFPRCRTLWLSKLATIAGVSSCEHEPSFNMKGMPDLYNYYCDARFASLQYVGISDSMVAPMLPNVLAMMPMPTLIITRDPQEVTASLLHNGLNPANLALNAQGISAVLNQPFVKVLPFDQISNSYKVRKALRWVMPDVKISLDRIEDMQKQVLTIDAEEMGIIWQRSEGRMGNMQPMITDGSYELFH